MEEFEEDRCMGDESYACVAKCWLVCEVAGGGSCVPQALSGRYYEMYMQMDVRRMCAQSTPPSFNSTYVHSSII